MYTWEQEKPYEPSENSNISYYYSVVLPKRLQVLIRTRPDQFKWPRHAGLVNESKGKLLNLPRHAERSSKSSVRYHMRHMIDHVTGRTSTDELASSC